MIAPRYIPTHIQNVYHDQDFTKHQKKLVEIQADDRKRRVVDKEGPAKAKLFETREKNLKFHNSEKLLAIEKDNEILLGRLVEISRKKKDIVGLSKSTNLTKTLNGPSRQREKDRIALENEAFAKRLLSQQALFNRKKLEVDYGKHLNLVKQMQRLENNSTRKLKLPPLKEKKTHQTEDEKEDLAEEEERREKEEQAKKDKEDKERKEKEEKEKNEREEKEKHEKEEKEKKEREEKEKKDKEEKEKKALEEAERLKKEKEANEKKENEDKEKDVPEAATTNQDKEQTPKEGNVEQENKEEKEEENKQ